MSHGEKEKLPKLFTNICKHYPNFIRHLLEDLVEVKSYFETEIAFLTQSDMGSIRKAILGDWSEITDNDFYVLMKLYGFAFSDRVLNRE